MKRKKCMNMKTLSMVVIVVYFMLCLSSYSYAGVLDFTVDSLKAEKLNSYKLNVDIKQSSVSGLSAGAFMADQFFIAFSDDMVGVGIFAGGPYGCAQGQVFTALNKCMAGTPAIDIAYIRELYNTAVNYDKTDKIDSLGNLKLNKKVYIFSGKNDPTVKQKVTDWIDDFYTLAEMPSTNILYKNDTNSGHAQPTLDYGNYCSTGSAPPWINDCDYDGAEEALKHIYGTLNAKSKTKNLSGKFIKFHQNEFFEPKDLTKRELTNKFSMNEFGFAYIPKSCLDGQQCKIHTVFHGCKQIYDKNPHAGDTEHEDTSNPFGLKFVKYAGYNEWADTNNIIVLYPQAQKLDFGKNPRGCYDWWAYLPGTANTYLTQEAPQMKAVYAMLQELGKPHDEKQCPVITLKGDNPLKLKRGEKLEDKLPHPDAIAQDPEDGDLTSKIQRTCNVDTTKEGKYECHYNVEDTGGCEVEEIRIVVVKERGCNDWTDTNATHKLKGRAQSCYYWFYCALGSGDYLGFLGTTKTAVRQEDPGKEIYRKGACPE